MPWHSANSTTGLWIPFSGTTTASKRERILLRWLEPENGEKDAQPDQRALIKRIQRHVKMDEQRRQLEIVAKRYFCVPALP